MRLWCEQPKQTKTVGCSLGTRGPACRDDSNTSRKLTNPKVLYNKRILRRQVMQLLLNYKFQPPTTIAMLK